MTPALSPELHAEALHSWDSAFLDEQSIFSDDLLRSDLEKCIAAPTLIPREKERLAHEIEIEQNPIRRGVLEWQSWHMEQYVLWAAKNAQARLDWLDELRTPEAQAEELGRCYEDPIHWFRAWAWTTDPRMNILKVIPFVPFKFQVDSIKWIDNVVRVRPTSASIDKARDQGMSWQVMGLADYYWLFAPYFQTLVGSYKQDLIDSKEKLDTLFEKARFMLRRLPNWMLPETFNVQRDMPYMKIANPINGSLIQGHAPTEQFGRQGRYSWVILDEFSWWPHRGYPQWTACSEAAQAKLMIATPNGESNQQADLRFSGTIPVKSLPWHLHPWKDDRWREGKTLDMSPTQIAQEIELDYRASKPGLIFSMYLEAFHIITWSQFEEKYGVRHIPLRWRVGRCQDVGTSEGHENTTDWFARPPINDPLHDTIFWYRSFVAPLPWSITEIAEGRWKRDNGKLTLEAPGLWQKEKQHRENQRMDFELLSWEAKSERMTYERDCKRSETLGKNDTEPIPWFNWTNIPEPGPNEGIAQAQALMQLLPEPHPFTNDPRTGKPLMGRPRIILIVEDNQGELRVDSTGMLVRGHAVDDDGLINPRYELKNYHYPVAEKGKPDPLRKPVKKDDNSMDNFRYCCREWGPSAAPKTREEEIEDRLPDQLKKINRARQILAKKTGAEIAAEAMARAAALWKIETEMAEEESRPRRGWRKLPQRK